MLLTNCQKCGIIKVERKMITIEEYIKLRGLPIDYSIPELNARITGTVIREAMFLKDIETFGDLFDKWNSIIYHYRVGTKARDAIYAIIARYLQIEDQMPNVDLAYYRYPTDNPKFKLIQSVIEKLDSERAKFENNEIEKSDSHKGLVASALQSLSSQPAENLFGDDEDEFENLFGDDEDEFENLFGDDEDEDNFDLFEDLEEDDWKDSILKDLKSSGIACLEKISKQNFKQDSENFNFISKNVEKYLNGLAKIMLKDKKSKSEIAKIIQSKMDEFKELVNSKRKELTFNNGNASFLSQMAAKIGEVRKYKRSTKTHKEEKEHIPYFNDGSIL